MTLIRNILAVVLSVSTVTAAHAGVHIVDFDFDANGNHIADGQIIDNEYAAWGVSISGCNLNGDVDGANQVEGSGCEQSGSDNVSGRQSAFDTHNWASRDNDLEFYWDSSRNNHFTREADAPYQPLTEYQDYYADLNADFPNNGDGLAWYESLEHVWNRPGNAMIIHENDTCSGTVCTAPDDEGERPAGFFTFEFADPVSILSLDFLDIEHVEAGWSNPTAATRLYFHLADNSIVEAGVPNTGNAGYERVSYSNMFNVTKLVVNMPGSGAINNLVFAKTSPVGMVSSPATIGLLMLFSVGLLAGRKFR
ncbi:hypothetical protein PN836_018330 [Ningiella sp. W23]|uniref:hypothetical protein n=1 Tax=Ningiella sp. W23 TaxID=3023715 RepID=UPI003758458C